MPDPVTAITVGGAAVGTAAGLVNVAAKQLQDFIAAVSGHPGESIGTMLGNLVRRRELNAEAVGNKANLILLNIGVKAQQVPLPVLLPLLERASLQEEPSMQDLWANLLANAADSRQQKMVSTAFTTILSEMIPEAVQFLDTLYPSRRTGLPAGPVKFDEFHVDEAFVKAGIIGEGRSRAEKGELTPQELRRNDELALFILDLLKRNQILEEIAPPPDLSSFISVNEMPLSSTSKDSPTYILTRFGISFINACRPPDRTQD